jgi:succinate dehydrogenase / fumarate reductase cytochrome b subunit
MAHNRPISPHLQIYHLPLTAILSICHRITGLFLCIGLLGLVSMLWQLNHGELSYLQLQSMLHTWFVQVILGVFIYALLFHLCHGVRHLIWDTGKSFTREQLTRYAQCELVMSCLLTIIVWMLL